MYALHCGRCYISCFFALLYFLFLPLFYILFFFLHLFLTSGSAEWNCVLICGLWSCGLISVFVRVRTYGCMSVDRMR